MSNYRHIMMAVDLSKECDRVGERAVELARLCNARLSLLHVVDQAPVDLSGEMIMSPPAEVDRQLIEDARDGLRRLAERLQVPDANLWVEIGMTREEILRTVREQGVDLLTLGRHSRHGLALLLGSTARSVLNDCPCDLLAIYLPD